VRSTTDGVAANARLPLLVGPVIFAFGTSGVWPPPHPSNATDEMISAAKAAANTFILSPDDYVGRLSLLIPSSRS
jgi:hypothetical protein